MAELHQGLGKFSFGDAILIFYDIQNLSRPSKVVARIRIRLIARDVGIGVCMMVKEVLLDQDSEAISQILRCKRGILDQLRDRRAAFGQ